MIFFFIILIIDYINFIGFENIKGKKRKEGLRSTKVLDHIAIKVH